MKSKRNPTKPSTVSHHDSGEGEQSFWGKHQHLLTLAAILVAYLVEPLLGDSVAGIYGNVMPFLVITIFYLITKNKTVSILLVCIILASLILGMLAGQYQSRLYFIIYESLIVLYGFILSIFVFWHVAKTPIKSFDHIFATITVFLLISMCFGLFYMTLNTVALGSFKLTMGDNASMRDVHTEFLYYSIITMTTLGYGDVLPASPFAKRLCSVQACIGLFYVSIFLSNMISMLTNKKNAG